MAGTARRRADTDADKAERRAELLWAAKSTFARLGFHTATMADVARAAGVSYGTVYVYFPSKELLFDAVVEAEGHRLSESVLDALAAAASPDADTALVEIVRSVFEHFGRDPDAARLLIRDASSTGFTSRFLAQLAVIVEDAQSKGRIRPGSSMAIAFSFAALIGQFVQRRLHHDDDMSDAEAAEFTVGVLLDGVRSR